SLPVKCGGGRSEARRIVVFDPSHDPGGRHAIALRKGLISDARDAANESSRIHTARMKRAVSPLPVWVTFLDPSSWRSAQRHGPPDLVTRDLLVDRRRATGSSMYFSRHFSRALE